MIRMKASEAKGPAYARGKQVNLVHTEDDFCLQIDAHSDAVQGWDTKLLQEWGRTNNEYAILSTYPTSYDHIDGSGGNGHDEMPHICGGGILEGPGRVRNHRAGSIANMEWPLLAPMWAAGLSFSRCHAERNVPTDPELKSIFMG